LLGRKFLIRTDHAALQWIQKKTEPIGQQARWCEILQEFDYNIENRAGTLHTNADAMSRRPCRQCGHADEEEIGADQFEEEIRMVQSAPSRVYESNDRTLLPPWAEGLFDKLKRGYIEDGKHKCRDIHFQTPSVDSTWHPQALREATTRDLELNTIYNLLSTFPDCPERDRLAYLDEITKSYCAD